MNATSFIMYMQQKASAWVSAFVLCGCVAITCVLVYSAYQADAIGTRLGDDNIDFSY